jgi:hypothetical protein
MVTGPVATSVVEPSLLLLVPSSVLDDDVDDADMPLPPEALDPLPVVVALDVPSDVLVLSPPSSAGHPVDPSTTETTIARSVLMSPIIPALARCRVGA